LRAWRTNGGSARAAARVRRFQPTTERLEDRCLLAAGFLQGYAYVDLGNNQVAPLAGATIQVTDLNLTTTTDSNGYYLFDNVPAGTHTIVETPPSGLVNEGTQIKNLVDTANSPDAATITVNMPLTPLTLTADSQTPSAEGGSFNLFGQQHVVFLPQFLINLHQSSNPVFTTPDFESFCTDVFHNINVPTSYGVTPDIVPMSPGLATNIGRIGYLYNHYGTAQLDSIHAAALQMALWELEYDATPDFNSGNFVLTGFDDVPDTVPVANFYLNDSAGKNERAFFLNLTDPNSGASQQGMIATESYNFLNQVNTTKNSVSFTTTASPGGTVGSVTLNDSALLSGGNNPTGTVVFKLFAPGNSVTPVYTDTITIGVNSGAVTGNGTYTTATMGDHPGGYTPSSGVGTYQWMATYSGDTNNKGASDQGGTQEQATLTQAGPKLNTTASPGGQLGSVTLNDTAVLSGGVSPTGTIVFKLFAPGNSNTPVYTDTVTIGTNSGNVTGNGTYTTVTMGDHPGGFVPTIVGTYTWTATYSGDSNNKGANDQGGTQEQATVGQGDQIGHGDTATIGFWNNKNGQKVIDSLNGDTSGGNTQTALGTWLATTFPNLYSNLNGATNATVEAYFQSLFGQSGQSKQAAQILAAAFAVYVTSSNLSGTSLASNYGFNISANGIGADFLSVGSDGAAFGVLNNTNIGILQALLYVNSQSSGGVLYSKAGANQNSYTIMAEDFFNNVNSKGDII
jgi:hypothetical protein